jgi:hypothetical protein
MSFSPFDPAVMRRVLGRPAPRADARAPAESPADRLERSADFETARMNDAYRQMEQAMRELLAHPFIREDAETLGRIEALLFCLDMDDFVHRFDRVARHIETRLAVLAGGGTDAAPATSRPAGQPFPASGTGAMPSMRVAPLPAQAPRDGEAAPRPGGRRMRLSL